MRVSGHLTMGHVRPALSAILIAGLTIGCRNGPDVTGLFSGRIMEAESSKPISGAVVMIVWTHAMNYFEGGRRGVDAREAVTDDQGRWHIPERTNRRGEGGSGGVNRRFYVFAPGYEVADARGTPRDELTPRETSVTTMRRLMSRGERCAAVVYMDVSIPNNVAKIPRYLEAIAKARQELGC